MKIYTKPDIMFETFELAENIAACDLISDHDQYVCAVLDPESGLTFFSSSSACMVTSPEGTGNICYEVPVEAFTVFKS